MHWVLYKNKLPGYLFVTIIILSILTLVLSHSGCNKYVYKMEVRQGNKIDVSKLEKININLTKEQVKEILGTPALEPLDVNRLDYFYMSSINQNKDNNPQHLILYFNDKNQLTNYSGNVKINNLPKK